MRVVVVLLSVATLGLLYSIAVAGDVTAAFGMAAIALVAGYFGWLTARTMLASRGTIDADRVVVRPVRVWGVRLRGPAGTFSRRQFKAVRVEQVAEPIPALGNRQERVSLIGREGTPDILVARSGRGAGVTLGRALAGALRLPMEHPASF